MDELARRIDALLRERGEAVELEELRNAFLEASEAELNRAIVHAIARAAVTVTSRGYLAREAA